jgi:hypothetical protein
MSRKSEVAAWWMRDNPQDTSAVSRFQEHFDGDEDINKWGRQFYRAPREAGNKIVTLLTPALDMLRDYGIL